ncbi:LRR receptor-like serine/threonine-protein kinase FLS2 [Cucumis melo var. makuwa]|uniref:LRR receptor-like serine/threonine-protein kinase FLS2 n=1 Tax=Cucumis melo var. makuwa TaxID=1194695 RepID=A0A5D3CXT5_CUCMM|nr:LRR receptor-like serine/threonine-protein kinase FLS2 [Cucumis melo var. makuwa]
MLICSYQASASCINQERESLLRLKASFIDSSNRLSSWKGTDCCKWDGVVCDHITNASHVVKLDLRNYEYSYSSALLSKGVDSSLFELKYLNYLDLSANFFNYTQTPIHFAELLELTYLNLSVTFFNGTIPRSLGNLSKLVVLDFNTQGYLYGSDGYYYPGELIVDGLEWVSSLSSLEYLDLGGVLVPSKSGLDLMKVFNAMPPLLSLKLSSCGLQNTYHHIYAPLNSSFLSKIQHLDLSYNMLDGPIPSILQNMTSMKFLNLYDNRYNSSIPSWLSNLKNLDTLNLGLNFLSSIQGGCQEYCLERLDLEHTQLGSHKIPSWLGELRNLKHLNLGNNSLYGPIPSSFGNLSNLEELFISYNMLTGEIPISFGKLSNLMILDLRENNLDGAIPKSFGQLTNLFGLDFSKNDLKDLSYNQITGALPNSIDDQMPNLIALIISNAHISGSLPQSLCRLKNLSFLRVSNNRLSGTISSCLSVLDLVILDLSSNNLQGVFPISFQNLSNLEVMNLARNQLEGEPLMAMRSFKFLSVLDLEGNKFCGNIPKWMGRRLHNLQILNLRGNMFNGTIPSTLWLLPRLQILILADNKLVGNIPPNVGNFSASRGPITDDDAVCNPEKDPWALCYVSYITQFIKSSPLNYSYLQLYSMVTIDLSNNNFHGHIPREVVVINGLIGLNLSHNDLSGTIPVEIGRSVALESLDLSFNQLFGSIPNSMSSLNSLGALNLSNNNFSGPIPREGHFSTFNDASSYEGNPYLCGEPLSIICPNENAGEGAIEMNDNVHDNDGYEEDKMDKMWFCIIVMVGFAFGFWVVVGTLILKKSWRHAYFRFVEETKERIHVAMFLNMTKLKQRRRRNMW